MTLRLSHTSIVTLLIATLFVTACSSGAATPVQSDANSNAVAQPTSTPVQPTQMSPQELGDQIGAVYVEALEKVTQLVESKPPAAEVKSRVADLKEQYIQQLVALGKQREALSAADRSAATTRISLALERMSSASWYTTYSDAVQYYNGTDSELSEMLASFNIIGQYAQFELLKKQEPAEAERLGIK